MSRVILTCEQYSPEWWEAHRGVPTASNFSKIITPKTGKLSASSADYICELIAQKATLGSIEPDGYVSQAMRNGTETEPEARKWYEMEAGLDVRQVGMIFSACGRFGCSPDGVIGDDGGLEIKCPMLKTQVAYLLDGNLPSEYRAQVHGFLIVSGRAWCDFLSYAPGLAPLLLRVTRDEYTDLLETALEQFWDSYQYALSRITINQMEKDYEHTDPNPNPSPSSASGEEGQDCE